MNFQITSVYTSLLALLFLYLSIGVIKLRRSKLIGLGDGEDRALRKAIRVHANFSEYIPISLILLFFLENSGLPNWYIHFSGGSLIISRLLHYRGITKSSGKSNNRVIGMSLIFLFMTSASIILLIKSFS